MIKTAILVDGAFYRKKANHFWGFKSPSERAEELRQYCNKHITKEKAGAELYRVFYYADLCAKEHVIIYLKTKTTALTLAG